MQTVHRKLKEKKTLKRNIDDHDKSCSESTWDIVYRIQKSLTKSLEYGKISLV